MSEPAIAETDDVDDGVAFQLLMDRDTQSGNRLRLLNRLQAIGYEVAREHANSQIQVYNVYPKPERDVDANRLPTSQRGETDGL